MKKVIHGFSVIDKDIVHKEIIKVCSKAILFESEISDIKVEYSRDRKEPMLLNIAIKIEGDFNGDISIETSSGYKNTNKGRVNIYYIFSGDCELLSNKGKKAQQLYTQYENAIIEEMIDIALDGKHYVEYSDDFKHYEIWSEKPKHNNDSIKGYIRDKQMKTRRSKEVWKNLKKIRSCKNIEELAEEILHGVHESYTEEWIEYIL